MSQNTAIGWTDATWNPVVGCTKVSQGCKHCYAKKLHDQRYAAFLAGKKVAPQYEHPFELVQLKPERLTDPLHWAKPRRVFVNSVSDLFHEDVPDEFITRIFAVMALAKDHQFQALTKRPERMLAQVNRLARSIKPLEAAARDMGYTFQFNFKAQTYSTLPWPIRNVWLGVSVENQVAADERIPLLLETPAAIRFLSCEPLLGPIDLHGYYNDWVIVGGESGKGYREMNLSWLERIVADCRTAGIPVFVKQDSGLKPGRQGRIPDELFVQEFPEGVSR